MSNFSYEKLWKLLKKKKMKKEDLRLKIQISSATSARLGKNQTVSMEVLGKICEALNCDIGDIGNVNVCMSKSDQIRMYTFTGGGSNFYAPLGGHRN